MNKFLGWYANLSKPIIRNHLMDARTNLVQYHGIIKSVKDETEEIEDDILNNTLLPNPDIQRTDKALEKIMKKDGNAVKSKGQ